MENKYYTPTIEEFHVGFEYKLPQGDVITVEETTDLFSIAEYLDMNTGIKVKYLDQEDIESFGFTERREGGNAVVWFRLEDNFQLVKWDNGKIEIALCGSSRVRVFDGVIKNKSELKKVLKMIGYELE